MVEAGSFSLPLDCVNSFTFQFQPKREKPLAVRDFDVPLFVSAKAEKDYLNVVELTSDIL